MRTSPAPGVAADAPCRFEGIADCADIAGFRGAHDALEHRGKHVCVLVRVNMSDGDTGLLQSQNLRGGFRSM